jgi:class 3 adenylate cyclase
MGFSSQLPSPRRIQLPGSQRLAGALHLTRSSGTLTAVEAPEVRYTKSGPVNIAYAVVGDGPFDLVYIVGSVFTALETAWDGPPGDFYSRLAAFSRLIIFDKRGTGLSDRVNGVPDPETRMDDVRAVMDAADSKRAAIMGVSEGGPMTLLFAATYPERTAAAILYGTGASFRRTDDYPWPMSIEQRLGAAEKRERLWGDPKYVEALLEGLAPSVAHDPEVKKWWVRYVRASASPFAAGNLLRMNAELDVRHVLPALRVPTLVMHRSGDDSISIEEARYVAERIPGAKLVEVPGRDHAVWVNADIVVGEVERFTRGIWDRGEWEPVDTNRVLATVLFTDVVGSTAKAVELGDAAWRQLINQHHAIVRRLLVRFRGTELDTAGDGFFASFDGPARAIRCACAITAEVRQIGLDVRAGLHSGECERMNGKVGGIAVHIGARVAAEAQPGEVLVSNTVRDLVAGSGLRFQERGITQFKGVPGEWRLYSVDLDSAS